MANATAEPPDYISLLTLLEQRKSIRGFLPTPIDPNILTQLFSAAQHAPSWCNVQPWRAIVTSAPLTKRVTDALTDAAKAGPGAPDIDFPTEYPSPYREHRRKCGHTLYAAMGIEHTDHIERKRAWLRNYGGFDAPHLAIICQDSRLGQYGTLDIGIWLGMVLCIARSLGVDTCPMASLAAYPQPLRRILHIPENQVILLGLALGYRDPQVRANQCQTDREPLPNNIVFRCE